MFATRCPANEPAYCFGNADAMISFAEVLWRPCISANAAASLHRFITCRVMFLGGNRMARHFIGLVCSMMLASSTLASASDSLQLKPIQVAANCGKSSKAAKAKLQELGGPMAGGGAGLKVILTEAYAGFRPGFVCVVDGPYESQDAAMSVAWAEAVPDAYVKKGC